MKHEDLRELLKFTPEADVGFDPKVASGEVGQLLFSGGCLYTYTSDKEWQVVEEYDKDWRNLIILLLALVRYPIDSKSPSHVITETLMKDDFKFYMENAEKLLKLKSEGIMNEETVVLEEFFDLPKQLRKLL